MANNSFSIKSKIIISMRFECQVVLYERLPTGRILKLEIVGISLKPIFTSIQLKFYKNRLIFAERSMVEKNVDKWRQYLRSIASKMGRREYSDQKSQVRNESCAANLCSIAMREPFVVVYWLRSLLHRRKLHSDCFRCAHSNGLSLSSKLVGFHAANGSCQWNPHFFYLQLILEFNFIQLKCFPSGKWSFAITAITVQLLLCCVTFQIDDISTAWLYFTDGVSAKIILASIALATP